MSINGDSVNGNGKTVEDDSEDDRDENPAVFKTPSAKNATKQQQKIFKEVQNLYDRLHYKIGDARRHAKLIDSATTHPIEAEEAAMRIGYLLDIEKDISGLSFELRMKELGPNNRKAVELMIDNFYSMHCSAVTFFKKIVQANEDKKRTDNSTQNTSPETLHYKLPEFKLPDFDGNPEKWITWKETFLSMIHNNAKLPSVIKFNFLKSAMRLPAGQRSIVDNFVLSENCYDEAWKAVCKRYDDTRRSKTHLFQRLMTVPTMKHDSAEELLRIVDDFSAIVTSLKLCSATYDELLVHIVSHRLLDSTKFEWQKTLSANEEVTFEKLMEFITNHSTAVGSVSAKSKKFASKPTDGKPSSSKTFTASSSGCVVCHESHALFMCPKFKSLTVPERLKVVNDRNLCRNCFSPQHRQRDCTSQNRCKICKKNHHTLLHRDFSTNNSPDSTGTQPPQAATMNPNVPPYQPPPPPTISYPPRANVSTLTSGAPVQVSTEALLSTVSLKALNHYTNQWVEVRALLDSGAQGNHITTGCVKKLGLQLIPERQVVTGINGQTSVTTHVAVIQFSSRYRQFSGKLGCTVSDDITGILPNRRIDVTRLDIPPGLFLADPLFHEPGQVDLLLGTGVFHDCLMMNFIRRRDAPLLMETEFGWVVGGAFPVTTSSSTLLSCYSQHANTRIEELDAKIEKFMELETFGVEPKKIYSPEQKYCLEFYEKTTRHDEEACEVTVKLPVKENIVNLESNYDNAIRQFFYQEKKRLEKPLLNAAYIEYIQMLMSTGRMSEVGEQLKSEGFYMPHHGVEKSSSTTTKVRPVNNGSSKSKSGLSLNDCLCVGPTVQPELFEILLRFREGAYVLKSDVERMYLQVKVDVNDRKYQKILWRNSPAETLRHFTLNCVTFGLAPSAFQATNTLNFAAKKYAAEYPEAAEAITKSFYVDDFVFSFDDLAEGIKIRDDVQAVLKKVGFPMRKWSANHPALLQGLPLEDTEQSSDGTVVFKTLGIVYDPGEDEIRYIIKDSDETPLTKVDLMSEVASFWDPMGLIGPVIVIAKLHMKKVRTLKWTEELPEEVKDSWEEFKSKLPALEDLRIPRHALIVNHVSITLHAFSDASLAAYGAVFYLRSSDTVGNVQITLLCSKSRVSPPKQLTIARLELCAATLMSKMLPKVLESLNCCVTDKFLWIDSMAVMYWIATEPSKLSVFVGHRVSDIREFTTDCWLRHCDSKMMPADKLSRGLHADEIIDDSLWFHGPPFLKLPQSEWPKTKLEISGPEKENVDKELRKVFVARKTNPLLTYIETKYSSIPKILRLFSRLRRFIPSNKYRCKTIHVDELDDANDTVIRILQQNFFPVEFAYFERQHANADSKENFPLRSPLLQLKPFMNSKRILCVGGRLHASPGLTELQKHPAIIPKCYFAKLIVRSLHQLYLHPGNSSLLSFVRERYWIIGVKNIIRQVKHECLACFRASPPLPDQIMADLPRARVEMTVPFLSTAVDFAGPLEMRVNMTRKSTVAKVYVAVFKCMATGAIHLEPVTALSTDAFIATFDRFVSRRGLSRDIYSDNATNFTGSAQEFKRILEEMSPKIEDFLREKSIRWHFTTPRAPHAGGYYEAAVKSMKHHLVRELGNRSFDFEQLTTLLCKIEAILNSRPLMPLSDDPEDFNVLTPAHFLIGRPLVAKPERNFLPTPTNRLDSYKQLQQLQQKFWNLWYHDYLHHLQTRPHRFRLLNEFRVGDLVLLKDDNQPSMKWKIGRVDKLYPDKYGEVRNVRVRMPKRENERTHEYKDRHIKYLAFLPTDSEFPAEAGVCSSTEEE